jgi:hypothetical protein
MQSMMKHFRLPFLFHAEGPQAAAAAAMVKILLNNQEATIVAGLTQEYWQDATEESDGHLIIGGIRSAQAVLDSAQSNTVLGMLQVEVPLIALFCMLAAIRTLSVDPDDEMQATDWPLEDYSRANLQLLDTRLAEALVTVYSETMRNQGVTVRAGAAQPEMRFL